MKVLMVEPGKSPYETEIEGGPIFPMAGRPTGTYRW